MGATTSADGTTIAFEQRGSGPALVLVNGAGGYRDFGSLESLAKVLEAEFTMFTYDRRGRGESGDTLPYAVDREVEDLAAVIEAAGGSACVYTVSSGGLLAMHAAAQGLPIPKLALFEPPINLDDDRPAEDPLTTELVELVGAGRHEEAAVRFLTSIGVPEEIVGQMGPTLPAFAAVAHTLVYDCRISEATSLATAAKVTAPTLVIDSEGTSDDLACWAASIVEALPNGTHHSLTGQWHSVPDADLAPVLIEFFRA